MDMNARCFEKSVKSASLEKNLQSAAHPTQKPVVLMEWSLGFAPDAQTVCDPFMGSGTTALAAKRCGRDFVGFELNPEKLSTWGHEVVGPILGPSVRTPEELLEPELLAKYKQG